MCNLYSITTNQAAIAALFRRLNRYKGNLCSHAGSVSLHNRNGDFDRNTPNFPNGI
jgi:hypothetical protein